MGENNKKDQIPETVYDMLENLIEQFSDVFCFYRELIQNSLDAGTSRVDIYLEFKPMGEGDEGIMIIHVDDYGEGMNKEIIDTQLTRLFSSSKERDFTKIGRFGIGFVSVFGIKPDAVSVDTSRDGEDWRILFDRTKRFEKIKRDCPVDGTKIQVIKKVSAGGFQKFSVKSKEAVSLWCKHAEADIYFNSEKINEPFDIVSCCKIRYETQGTEVVMGYTKESPPFFGFYNRGLTLLEGRETYFEKVSFKIKSRYLEHTLTRDNVIKDENYEKAMKILEELAKNQLKKELFLQLERALKDADDSRYETLVQFVDIELDKLRELKDELRGMKIFPSIDGSFFSISDIIRARKKGKYLYFDHTNNSITMELIQEGHLVARARRQSNCHAVLDLIFYSLWSKGELARANDYYCRPEIISSVDLLELEKNFLCIVKEMIQCFSMEYRDVRFGVFTYEGSIIADKFYVTQEREGELTSADEKKPLFGLFPKPRLLILNRGHEFLRGLLKFAEKDAELAAYLLIKLLCIKNGIAPKIDSKLISLSLKRRGF